MDTKEICIALASKGGGVGDEGEIAQYALSLLKEYMPANIDSSGNVIGNMAGKGKRILLDAHMDRVGLIVTEIDSEGFIHFDKCGGTDVRVLKGCEVTVFGRKKLFGVVCSVPPHLISDKVAAKKADIKKLAVDTGMPYSEVIKYVETGDRITYRSEYYPLGEDVICGSAFDDRCGMATILLCLELMKKNGVTAPVSVQFSVQEERGKSGAQTAAFTSEADECIAIDVGFACQPGVTRQNGIAMGQGPAIGFSPILDSGMTQRLIDIAVEKGIPFQTEAMGGLTRTDADAISVQRGGVRCALLSVPLRSMHTACESVNIHDVDATARLLYEYIISGSDK